MEVVSCVQTVVVIKMEGKVVSGKFHLASFIRMHSRAQRNKIFWDCRIVRSRQSNARLLQMSLQTLELSMS